MLLISTTPRLKKKIPLLQPFVVEPILSSPAPTPGRSISRYFCVRLVLWHISYHNESKSRLHEVNKSAKDHNIINRELKLHFTLLK